MSFLPRLGKIKTGEIKGNRPVSLDYFIFPDASKIESVDGEAIAENLIEKYGETPTVLDVKFPSDDINVFMPRSYKRYVKSGLICKSKIAVNENGKETHSGKAVFIDPSTKEQKEISCNPEDCEHYNKEHCRKICDLYFFLPKIKGFGVWHITTKAYTSMRNIQNMTGFIKSQTGGKIALVPLRLAIEKNTVPRKENGKTINQAVNSLNIDLGNLSIDELLEKTLRPVEVKGGLDEAKENTNISNIEEIENTAVNYQEESSDPKIKKVTRVKIGKALEKVGLDGSTGLKEMESLFGVSQSDKLTEKQGQQLIKHILEKGQKIASNN